MSKVLKLDIDLDGNPYIKIDGHFASNDVEEKLLSQFINKAIGSGIEIKKQSDVGDYAHITIKGDQVGVEDIEKNIKIMPDKKTDFDEYLQEQHALQYTGIKDLMIDNYSEWLEDLDIEEWLEYGDKFVQELLKGKD